MEGTPDPYKSHSKGFFK